MAIRISVTMALCLVFSLMAVAHCVPLEEAVLATNASSVAVPAAEVHAVSDEQGLLRLPSSDDSVVPGEVEEAVKPVAEPDPDRSHPSSDGEEELTVEKLAPEGQQGDEKTKDQIDDDEEEKRTKKKNHDGDDKEEKKEKKKRKKHHEGDDKGKKEKKTKKHHQSNEEEEEEEERKKHIHRHHHVEKEKTKKRPHHTKNSNNNGDDSDDEDEQETKAKRWRKKAISRSRFGHGHRSQREEAQTEEVKN